jgi:hypothetical protein
MPNGFLPFGPEVNNKGLVPFLTRGQVCKQAFVFSCTLEREMRMQRTRRHIEKVPELYLPQTLAKKNKEAV